MTSIRPPNLGLEEARVAESLGINQSDLGELLNESWFTTILHQYKNDVLHPRHLKQTMIVQGGSLCLPSESHIEMDTIEQATALLCSGDLGSASLVPLDHITYGKERRAAFDVRFLVQMVSQGRGASRLWSKYQDQIHTYSLCRKSSCLLSWLLKTYTKESSWRTFLRNMMPDVPSAQDPIDVFDCGSRNIGEIIVTSKRQKAPEYEMKQSTETPGQQKGVDWLSSFAQAEFHRRYKSLANK